MNLITAIKTFPDVIEALKTQSDARDTAIRLFKEGHITEQDFGKLLSGMDKMTINIQTLNIDNSTEVSSGGKIISAGNDNSIDICQSDINGKEVQMYEGKILIQKQN